MRNSHNAEGGQLLEELTFMKSILHNWRKTDFLMLDYKNSLKPFEVICFRRRSIKVNIVPGRSELELNVGQIKPLKLYQKERQLDQSNQLSGENTVCGQKTLNFWCIQQKKTVVEYHLVDCRNNDVLSAVLKYVLGGMFSKLGLLKGPHGMSVLLIR